MEAALATYAPRQSPPLIGTESAKNAIARVTYTHDAMINLIIANPGISQNEIAKHFGYGAAWVSRVRNSDAFLARLAQRQSDIIDPSLFAMVDENLRAVANKSLEVVLDKLHLIPTFQEALDAASMATKALGYGARSNNLAVQNNFVVAMPDKAPSGAEWANKYSGQSPQLQAMVAEAVDVAEEAQHEGA